MMFNKKKKKKKGQTKRYKKKINYPNLLKNKNHVEKKKKNV